MENFEFQVLTILVLSAFICSVVFLLVRILAQVRSPNHPNNRATEINSACYPCIVDQQTKVRNKLPSCCRYNLEHLDGYAIKANDNYRKSQQTNADLDAKFNDAIKNGRIKKAITIFEEQSLCDSDLKIDLLLIESRFNRLEDDYRAGKLSFEERERMYIQIQADLLNLWNKLIR